MQSEIFDLDVQASTKIDPKVLSAMLPYMTELHWNPHAAHRGARRTKAAIEAARMQIAQLLGGSAEQLHFTSGATESNNLALKGLLGENTGPRRRLITFATEHSSVIEPAEHIAKLGVPVTILPVLASGMPDMEVYHAALADDVALVSMMMVNNEIGSIWPIAEMAALAKSAGSLVHVDAAQAFGKIECNLQTTLAGADLVSITAHKIYGPKGIGALWARSGLKIAAQLDGGHQEDIRSGTLSPALVAGFGAAASIASRKMDDDFAHVSRLAEIAREELAEVRHSINGPSGPGRWPGNLSVAFAGVDANRLFAALPDIALSSGAACSSGADRPSRVLTALGLPDAIAKSTVRIGWGRFTPEDGFRTAIKKIVMEVQRFQQ